MLRKIFFLLAMVPVLNFSHESGHWLGARLVGADPKMLLQRVDLGDESQFSPRQISVYNWSGPVVNYAFIGASFLNPVIAPFGLIMTCHRLGPNVFASYLYWSGNRNFTTDETKQFSKENRFWVAVLFSVIYLGIAIVLIMRAFPSAKLFLAWMTIPIISGLWFGYLIFLDYLDKKV